MTLTALQEHYWRDRYALRNPDGETVETTIEETWDRVSNAIARDVDESFLFREVLEDFKFVPGGRILAGAGAESDKTFYNCYVIPVETAAARNNRKPASTIYASAPDLEMEVRVPEWQDDKGADSREAIFDTINTMVGIMSRGGGVGINWSVLRPRDSYLTRVSGHSSGPVGWMDVASTAVGEVIQGGSRRGAAMFMLDIWHPDVLDFINAKRDNSKITNANISVGVSDKFMRALANGENWTFVFPDTTHEEYNRSWDGDINGWVGRGLPVVQYKSVPARSVWESISEAAHASGEPGVIFIDRYNEQSTANGEERIICVNPCGEQGLGAYSVCNLGAMNLYAYIKKIPLYYKSATGRTEVKDTFEFDFDAFAADVGTAIRFLDAVIDKTPDYLPETADRQKSLRRIGLGVMGLADALVALDIRYGSDQAVTFTETVFMTMKDAAIRESQTLAEQYGPAEGWKHLYAQRPYLKEYTQRTARPVGPMRNLFMLTQAPTGTTSLLAGVNSGIEPYFNLATWREDRTGGTWVVARAVEDRWGKPAEGGPLPKDYDHVVTSGDVTVDEHIAMQAAVQKYVDSSVSKTVNAPKDQTVQETARVFDLAYANGLKGIAYYRDGSRDKQVLYHEKPMDRISELEAEVAGLKAKLEFKSRAFSTEDSTPLIPMEQGANCPECRTGTIVYEEGCQKCYGCGWSAC